jgi:sulfatase maturation enzyme AslB (radical SAM superfamily)
MPKINLKENKSFCLMPFVHLHIRENNDMRICCNATMDHFKKFDANFNFETDEDLKEIRSKMLNGEPVKFCKTCYDLEDKGAQSFRLKDTKEWQMKLNVRNYEDVKTNLVYYDIRNDNICNLSCRMCLPNFSSQLQKEYKVLGWAYDDIDLKNVGFNQIVDLETVKKIQVAGGEPSIMPDVKLFLKKAIDAGRNDLEVRIISNVTNINKEYASLLKEFNNLYIIASMDGFEKLNYYIRWPSDWDTIVSNLKSLSLITNNLSFNVAVSIWNISKLSDLIKFLEKEFPTNKISLSKVPQDHQCYTLFPNKEIVLGDLNEIKQLNSYKCDANFRSMIDFIEKETLESEVDIGALEKFFNYNDALDKNRNIFLKDYIPELEECRKLITKQI